jgi:hypothetical protein
MHYATKLKQENERLKAALDYMQYRTRVVVQSRFDKYRNANGPETMAYLKCAKEIDDRVNGAICVSQEILDGETKWDSETSSFVEETQMNWKVGNTSYNPRFYWADGTVKHPQER